MRSLGLQTLALSFGFVGGGFLVALDPTAAAPLGGSGAPPGDEADATEEEFGLSISLGKVFRVVGYVLQLILSFDAGWPWDFWPAVLGIF